MNKYYVFFSRTGFSEIFATTSKEAEEKFEAENPGKKILFTEDESTFEELNAYFEGSFKV